MFLSHPDKIGGCGVGTLLKFLLHVSIVPSREVVTIYLTVIYRDPCFPAFLLNLAVFKHHC